MFASASLGSVRQCKPCGIKETQMIRHDSLLPGSVCQCKSCGIKETQITRQDTFFPDRMYLKKIYWILNKKEFYTEYGDCYTFREPSEYEQCYLCYECLPPSVHICECGYTRCTARGCGYCGWCVNEYCECSTC